MNHPLPPKHPQFKQWPDGQWVFCFANPLMSFEIPIVDLEGDALEMAKCIARCAYLDAARTEPAQYQVLPDGSAQIVQFVNAVPEQLAEAWRLYRGEHADQRKV